MTSAIPVGNRKLFMWRWRRKGGLSKQRPYTGRLCQCWTHLHPSEKPTGCLSKNTSNISCRAWAAPLGSPHRSASSSSSAIPNSTWNTVATFSWGATTFLPHPEVDCGVTCYPIPLHSQQFGGYCSSISGKRWGSSTCIAPPASSLGSVPLPSP